MFLSPSYVFILYKFLLDRFYINEVTFFGQHGHRHLQGRKAVSIFGRFQKWSRKLKTKLYLSLQVFYRTFCKDVLINQN